MGNKWAQVSEKYDVEALKEALKTKEKWAVDQVKEIAHEFSLSISFIYKYFGAYIYVKVKRERPEETILFIKNEVTRQTGWTWREFIKRLKNNERLAIHTLHRVKSLSGKQINFFCTRFKEIWKHDFQRVPRD